MVGTYKWYFVIQWMQVRCWRHSIPIINKRIWLKLLHSQAEGTNQKLQAPLLLPELPGETFTIFCFVTLRYFMYKPHRQLSAGPPPNIWIREAMMWHKITTPIKISINMKSQSRTISCRIFRDLDFLVENHKYSAALWLGMKTSTESFLPDGLIMWTRQKSHAVF